MSDIFTAITPKPRPLDGKLALITGCTGGIGQATALALARLGCSVAVHHHRAAPTALLAALASAAPTARFRAFQADLSSYDEAHRLHADVVREMGEVDVLFNNAGIRGKVIGAQGNIQDLPVEEFENTWRTNLGTAYLLTQLCIPHMEKIKWGRVIFCSSVAAGTGGVIGPHYASSKSAMHGLIHWIAARYAKEGITCNGVAPALVKDAPDSLRERIPVGRFGQPDEIASVVAMLATNSYMTNKIIVADGGWTATGF